MDLDLLYRRYGPMVMRRCRRILRDEEEARDAAQDVFVQLLMRQKRLRDDAPSSLLYRMATNLLPQSHPRRRKEADRARLGGGGPRPTRRLSSR